MKQLITAIVVSGLVISTASTAGVRVGVQTSNAQAAQQREPQPVSTDEEELKRLDAEWFAAYPRRDGATLDRIIADDFFVIRPDGKEGNKADVLKGMTSPQRITQSQTRDDVRVRLYGNTAVVTSHITMRGTEQGRGFNFDMRDYHWFVKRAGRWRGIAGIGVPITPQPVAQTNATAATTQATAQRAFDAFKHSIETGETGPLLAVVTDDVTFSIGKENGWEGEKKGKAALVEHTDWRWNTIRLRSPVVLERTTMSGNTAIFEFRLNGTVQGNKPFKKNVVILFDVQGDKVSGFREYTG